MEVVAVVRLDFVRSYRAVVYRCPRCCDAVVAVVVALAVGDDSSLGTHLWLVIDDESRLYCESDLLDMHLLLHLLNL